MTDDYNHNQELQVTPQLTWQERLVIQLRYFRWKYSVWPSLQIRLSRPWRKMRHLFRKECGTTILCTFGRKPHIPGGPIYYSFSCRLKRGHSGPCREDKLMDWTCGPTSHRPGMIPWNTLNREKFDVLRNATSRGKS